MNLRRARADDAPRLAALAQWVWLDSYAAQGVEQRFLPYLAESFTPAAFESVIADPQQAVWVIEEGEEGKEGAALQGFAQIGRGVPAPLPAAAPNVELKRLYVAPPCTGRGLGSLLLQAARETWPGDGLWLSVWVGNTGALRFYAREGGQLAGHTHFMLDGQAIDNQVIAFP